MSEQYTIPAFARPDRPEVEAPRASPPEWDGATLTARLPGGGVMAWGPEVLAACAAVPRSGRGPLTDLLSEVPCLGVGALAGLVATAARQEEVGRCPEAARAVLAAARQDARRRVAAEGHDLGCGASPYAWGLAVAKARQGVEVDPASCMCKRRRRRGDPRPVVEVGAADVLAPLSVRP